MSLLVDMMADTLDQSYRERAQVAVQGPARRPAGLVGVALLVLLGLLSGTAVAAARARQQAGEGLRSGLGAQAREQAAATDALAGQVEQLRSDVEQVRARALGTGAQGRASAAALAALAVASATSPVRGPGLTVTVDDAPTGDPDQVPVAPGGLPPGRVQDRDLQDVVNALWAAGAEAVAVNGQRLTALSAIRSAGETVLVDFTLLAPPYVVAAVGDTDALQLQLVDGPAGRRLSTLAGAYGIVVDVRRASEVSLAAAGVPALRHAVPVTAAGARR